MPTAPPFHSVVADQEELRSIFRSPSHLVLDKAIDHLDHNCVSFLAHSPFVLIGSSDPAGPSDLSPKGGPPGFAKVLDPHRLAIGDLPGNNRIDTWRNVVANPHVGLLFLIPGLGETLRVNGRAWLVRDDDVLDACAISGRRPPVALGVAVDEAFIHCAKAFRRSDLWDPQRWPDRADMPTVACMLIDHVGIVGQTGEQVEAALEMGYEKTMWHDA